jgi:CheY-like chemotaxis protein/signal transduction histidine kinase
MPKTNSTRSRLGFRVGWFHAGSGLKLAIVAGFLLAGPGRAAPIDWTLSVAPRSDSLLEIARAERGDTAGFKPFSSDADARKVGSTDSIYTFRADIPTNTVDSGELYMGIGVVTDRVDIHWNREHVFRMGTAQSGRKSASYQGSIVSLSSQPPVGAGSDLLVVQVFPTGFAFRPPEIRIGGYAEIGHFAYLTTLLNLVVPAAGSLASLIMCVFVVGLWRAMGRTRDDWLWFAVSAFGIALSFTPTIFSSPLHPSHFPTVVGRSGVVLASISNSAFLLIFLGLGRWIRPVRFLPIGLWALYFLGSLATTDLVGVEAWFGWALDLVILPGLFAGFGALGWHCWKHRSPGHLILALGFVCLFCACMHDLYFYRTGLTPMAWLFPVGFLGMELAMVVLIARDMLVIWSQNQERALALVQRGEELNRQRILADDALRVRAQFLDKMAHEFRTPMQGLMGMVDLLKGGGSGIDKSILDGTDRLLKRHLVRINNVIDQMDLRQGSLSLRQDRFDPDFLLEGWKRFFVPVVEPATSFVPSEPDFVLGDAERIDRAVVSIGQILSEGMDDMVDVDGVRRNDSFEVVLSRRHARAAHLQERLFGSASTWRQELDDASALVFALGGRLDMQVDDGKISCVLVFPVESAPWRRQGSDGACSLRETPIVLLAEDERINAKLVVTLLERSGCRAVWARDGQEAIDLAAMELPDLILMDINMPIMDGLEAARILRSDTRTAGIPVVAVSAHAHQDVVLSEGIDGFVAKPLRAASIRELVDRYCRRRG